MLICPLSKHNLPAVIKPIFPNLIKIKSRPPAPGITKTPTNPPNTIHSQENKRRRSPLKFRDLLPNKTLLTLPTASSSQKPSKKSPCAQL
jgi:hypothetical protein